jgi:hypothetical protein
MSALRREAMNERINELMEQAGLYDFVIESMGINEEMEKFAELIVRDCMDVVDGYTKQRTFDTHYDAVEQIEALFGIKHFGVEE